MTKFLETILPFIPILEDLVKYLLNEDSNPEREKQIAMDLLRKASDEKAKREIPNP